MEIKKKPWYIWLSVIGFVYLWGDTSRRILMYEHKNKIKLGDDKEIWLNHFGYSFFCLWIGHLLIPFIFLGVLYNVVERHVDEFIALIINCLVIIIAYFLGVYVMSKYIVWREKNISHILKSTSNKE